MNVLKYIGLGAGHVLNGTPFQDAAGFAVGAAGHKKTTLALSDGCSAFKTSQIGSAVSVETVLRFFHGGSDGSLPADASVPPEAQIAQIKKELLRALNRDLAREAADHGLLDASGLAATLAFAVDAAEDGYILIGGIGDSHALCFVRAQTGGYLPAAEIPAERFENAENVTFYPNDPDAFPHLRLRRVPRDGVSHIMLFSDGLDHFFRQKGGGDLRNGACVLLEELAANRTETCGALAERLERDQFGDIANIYDDWSLLICSLEDGPLCADQPVRPRNMAHIYLDAFLAEHPEAREENRTFYEKACARDE